METTIFTEKARVEILRARLQRALKRALIPADGHQFNEYEIRLRTQRIVSHAAHIGWLLPIKNAAKSEKL